MTVQELVDKLQKYPKDLPIIVFKHYCIDDVELCENESEKEQVFVNLYQELPKGWDNK